MGGPQQLIRGTEPGVGGRSAEAPPSGGHGGHLHLQASHLSSGLMVRRGLQTPGSEREASALRRGRGLAARVADTPSPRRWAEGKRNLSGVGGPLRAGEWDAWAPSPLPGQARHVSPLLTPAPEAAYFTEEDTGPDGRGAGPHGRGLRTGPPPPRSLPCASSHIVSGPQPGGHLSPKSQNRSPRQVNPSGDIG